MGHVELTLSPVGILLPPAFVSGQVLPELPITCIKDDALQPCEASGKSAGEMTLLVAQSPHFHSW